MTATYFDTRRATPSLFAQAAEWLGFRQPSARAPHTAPARAAACSCGSTAASCAKPPAESSACDIAALLAAEQQRGREMERALSQYVAPDVLARLMADPDGANRGGETRDVTVLFADLQGFTSLAEALKDDPGRLADLINAFLDPMTDIVLAHGGTIDKYMGDCVMAFWGAPSEDPDHPRRALEAGQAMIAAMDEVKRRFQAVLADVMDPARVEIGISIGVNSGECVVGNVGSRRRFDYSVLGDPVNVASRLEGLCKTYGVSLLVGEATASRLGADASLGHIDRVNLRGRSQRLNVFGLTGSAVKLAA